jgi:hypothetical protein
MEVVTGDDGIARCWWCAGDPQYESYEDARFLRPGTSVEG